MSFNVNFLGHIPYNPDNLHHPQNEKKDAKPPILPTVSSGRLLSFSFYEMMKLYWTVRSFEIRVGATVADTVDPFSQFLAGGGTSGGIIGAQAGLASTTQARNGGVTAKGYTKIYSKYNKKVRKSREGIINSITQPDFNDLGGECLDLDDEIDPNMLESHIYKPNEGTLCSAGPIHIFSDPNVLIVLDFSDIIYFSLRPVGARFYWPKVTILINVPSAGASFGNQIRSQVLTAPGSFGFTNQPLSFINLNVPGSANNLGSTQINSQLFTTQIANVTIDIRPGQRCCDRFSWDGKDEDRQEDSETKTPREDSEESCKDVCGDEDPDPSKKLTGGVYAKRSEKRDGV